MSKTDPQKRVIFFDVVETLFSLQPLETRLSEMQLPAAMAPLFFSQLLRDAFALQATGSFHTFPEIARGTLEVMLHSSGYRADDTSIKQILGVFAELPLHDDVKPALETLSHSDCQAVLLTNGSRANSEQLVRANGIEHLVDGLISIEDFQVWKPCNSLYEQAARAWHCAPQNALLLAAHAWDVHGALSAGLNGIWLQRQDSVYHPLMHSPHAKVHDMQEAVSRGIDLLMNGSASTRFS